MPGAQLVFRLFVALAIVTAAVLLYFASIVEPQFRTRIYVSLVGDLLLPVVAWFIFKAMNKRRDRRRPATDARPDAKR